MTDKHGQSTEEPRPATHDEAVENLNDNPALGSEQLDDAATDDDARTPDTAPVGNVKKN